MAGQITTRLVPSLLLC